MDKLPLPFTDEYIQMGKPNQDSMTNAIFVGSPGLFESTCVQSEKDENLKTELPTLAVLKAPLD